MSHSPETIFIDKEIEQARADMVQLFGPLDELQMSLAAGGLILIKQIGAAENLLDFYRWAGAAEGWLNAVSAVKALPDKWHEALRRIMIDESNEVRKQMFSALGDKAMLIKVVHETPEEVLH